MVELAHILRQFGPVYQQTYQNQLLPSHRRAIYSFVLRLPLRSSWPKTRAVSAVKLGWWAFCILGDAIWPIIPMCIFWLRLAVWMGTAVGNQRDTTSCFRCGPCLFCSAPSFEIG